MRALTYYVLYSIEFFNQHLIRLILDNNVFELFESFAF